MTFDNIRGVIYGEISLLCGPQGSSMYNTTGLNNQTNPNDTAPASLWDNVSEQAMAQQYNVPAVWKNGRRGWTTDKIQLQVGPTLDFNGLKARWFAYPAYPPDFVFNHPKALASTNYKPNTITRTSVISFYAGKPVFTMVDPNGNTWIMQAWAMINDPNLTYNDLFTLGQKLTLPTGWKYQVITLKRPLRLSPRMVRQQSPRTT